MKQAVCVILDNNDGQLVGVSRRGRPDDMNLPGGKVDPGETLEEACIREVREETGLEITDLEEVFHRPCVGEDTYECYTFIASHEGTPQAMEEGFTVRWITWEDLLKPTNSFAEYNKRLFDHLHRPVRTY